MSDAHADASRVERGVGLQQFGSATRSHGSGERLAVVQVPAYDEPEHTFQDTLYGILEQPVPAGWTVAYEAWVTPRYDRDPTHWTAHRAGYDTYEAPPGKLTTRNVAHDHALQAGADAIVTWDADAPPLTNRVLANLLVPLEDPGIAATNAVPVAHRSLYGNRSVVGMAVDVGGWIEDAIRPHLHGQCSAFAVDVWEGAGPFDDTIDQRDVAAVREEEEFDFYHRVAAYGDIIRPGRAEVYNDPRRHVCQFPLLAGSSAGLDYCDRLGSETFAPRSRDDGRR